MKCMGFFSCGGIERFDEMKFIGMVLIVVLVEDFYFVKDVKNKQVEDFDFLSSILMFDSCNVQFYDLFKLDWMEFLFLGWFSDYFGEFCVDFVFFGFFRGYR